LVSCLNDYAASESYQKIQEAAVRNAIGSTAEPPEQEDSSDRREHDQRPRKSVNPIMAGIRLVRQRTAAFSLTS